MVGFFVSAKGVIHARVVLETRLSAAHPRQTFTPSTGKGASDGLDSKRPPHSDPVGHVRGRPRGCRLFSPTRLAQVAVAAAAPADWHPLPARGDRAGGPARGPGAYPWS